MSQILEEIIMQKLSEHRDLIQTLKQLFSGLTHPEAVQ